METKSEADDKKHNDKPLYQPTDEEIEARNRVLKDFITGRNVLQKSYNQFNGRTLMEAIDDWTKRWNGYIPPTSMLLDDYQSRIFLNFTRNQTVSYLSKVAMQRPRAKIKAVNKNTSMADQRMSDILEDLNKYSSDEENGEARFMDNSLEVTIKGTVVVYEGYRKEHQKMDVPVSYDAETGKLVSKNEDRVIFDNCFQRLVPLEDFYIANPYEPNVQKQPFVIERVITTDYEAKGQYGKHANWKYVKPGSYTVAEEPTTFYRNKLITDLQPNQVEILRYFNKKKNLHIVLVNGVVLYNSAIPFKDGNYPYAKGIFEPFEVPFFWGMGFPNKIMGEQDLMNTFINMMADKTFGSLLPYGLSSDLDDLIEDDVLQPNKIRKVGDINKWKFETLPGVNAGEQSMFQTVINLARENSGDVSGGGSAMTPRGGKITARQALLKQQESMQKLGFSMNFLEDLECDRTKLRINHIIQFYSIPKVEKITGHNGKEIDQLMYRDVRLDEVKLSSMPPYNGKTGTRVIKLVGDEVSDPNEMQKLKDDMALTEAMGEETNSPTEVLAIKVDSFYDYNFSVQVVKNSSYEQNQALEQAQRHEYAQWRLEVQQMGYPVNMKELISWVDESHNIDTDRFEVQQQPQIPGQPGQEQGQPGGQPGQPPNPQLVSPVKQPSKVEMGASSIGGLV